MRIYLKNNGYAVSERFPMTFFEMEDVLDKLKQTESVVRFEISEYDNMKLPSSIWHREFSADIYKLNLFAERLEKLNSSDMTAFKSLLTAKPDCDFEDILKMTYGLDSVMIYPCSGCRELGETVIENEMMPELEGCSDEILALLDPEKVGQLMQKRDGGVFINEHYCVTSGYEPPDINIKIGRPEKCFFRLLTAPDFSKTDQSQWITLPCERAKLFEIYDGVCLEFQSSLPSVKFSDTHQIGKLNKLAESLSYLYHGNFIKLKAIIENEQIHEISDVIDCIGRLDEYEFDMNISDQSDFGRAYLLRNLPTNFDNSVLESMDLYDFSVKILAQTGGEVTSYGAISGRGQELYSALTVQPEQQLEEEFEEDIEEDFEPEMGGMSL